MPLAAHIGAEAGRERVGVARVVGIELALHKRGEAVRGGGRHGVILPGADQKLSRSPRLMFSRSTTSSPKRPL